MSAEEIVRGLRTSTPKCYPINCDRCTGVIDSLDCDYFVAQKAADMIESLMAQLAEKDAEIKRLNGEPPAYKFYYCESEDSYLLGRRVDNYYYAHWHDRLGFVWDMSRYLPWGEHIVAPDTLWKEHTYPSEPKEIDLFEWFSGFLAQQLAASQQRERAMLSDMAHEMECGACCHVRVDVCDEPCASCRRENSKFKWRGPQQDGNENI